MSYMIVWISLVTGLSGNGPCQAIDEALLWQWAERMRQESSWQISYEVHACSNLFGMGDAQ